ncbi:MAG: DEAD/DEAH box helicase [Flavobacteriales bacterium]
MTFKDLNITEPILKALDTVGYTHPTPIQELAIPILLKGRDLLGCAQTGTGKTAAFSIPIIQHLNSNPQVRGKVRVKALVVTPTRELAIQIADNFTTYSRHTSIKNTVIFGGVKQGQQVRVLKAGVDVIIATPGRLLDLMNQGYISLRDIKYFALDEADQMLEMGFIHDIKKIIAKLPRERQSLFFSATMPPKIVQLANQILGNPEQITIQPEQTTAERVEQLMYFVDKSNKPDLLSHIIKEKNIKSLLVFTRTKHGANKVVKNLIKVGISAAAIHGNKSQNARQKALTAFKAGEIQVLVATDIAARGIDVDQLKLVVNYELPNIPETYVHRIGRTGRAKASGVALSFCDEEEKAYLVDIQKLIKQNIELISEHPFPPEFSTDLKQLPKKKPKAGGSRGKSSGSGSRNSKNARPSGSKPQNKRNSNSRSDSSRSGSSSGRNRKRPSSSSSSTEKKKNKRFF